MCMKASNSKGDARTVGYEGGKIHCLWRALEQGLFPFMMNEVGELTEKNKVFVAVCEAAVKPETFEYAKWKGIGRPPVDHMAVYKAFLFKAVHDVPTTKEMIERLMLEPQSRRLCGWIWPEDVPCEAKFSEVNKEFSQMEFTDEWFGDFVKTFVGTEGRMSV